MSQFARLAALMLVCGALGARAQVKVFVGARLADARDGVIVVRDGRVEAIGAKGTVKAPKSAETIDLAGKYVIPGLISAHVHVGGIDGVRPAVLSDANTPAAVGCLRAVRHHDGVEPGRRRGSRNSRARQPKHEQARPVANLSRG